jgi:hypothetical protein
MVEQGAAAASFQQFIANSVVLSSSCFMYTVTISSSHMHAHDDISCCLLGFWMTAACGTGEAWASVAKANMDGPNTLTFVRRHHSPWHPRVRMTRFGVAP